MTTTHNIPNEAGPQTTFLVAGAVPGWFMGDWSSVGKGCLPTLFDVEGPAGDGPLVLCAMGDTLILDGVSYTLTLDSQGHPHLNPDHI